METYTILVCVLALIFCFVLSFVIILAVKLRKHYFHQSKKRSEYGPFTPEERRSLTKEHRKKLDSLSIVDEEPDNVFEDEDLTDASQITFSLLHIPTDDVLLLDVWSVTDTPSGFIKGFVEAQLFPTDFDAGQFCTNVREVFHNEIKNNEGFSFPNVSSEVLANNTVIYNESFAFPNISSQVLANVYLKLFLYTTYEVSQPKCVGHTVFALNEVAWNPLGKTQFKQELRHHQANESPPAITDEKSPCASPSRAEKGELYISLRYQRNSGRINVVVLKAENIQKGSVLQSDPYVKIKLLYQGEVIEKKQTKSQRRNSSPCWNEPFAFNIDEERGLNNYELIFLVRRRDLLSPNSTLGIVRVGAQVRGAGQSHWYAMMAKGNLMRQVARRHRIK